MKITIKASSLSNEDEKWLIEQRNEITQQIYDILSNYPNLASSEVWGSSDSPVFYVEVDYGDWKHEHLLLKHIMMDYGFQFVDSVEEDSGDDCYTATHSFMPPTDQYEDYIELMRQKNDTLWLNKA